MFKDIFINFDNYCNKNDLKDKKVALEEVDSSKKSNQIGFASYT